MRCESEIAEVANGDIEEFDVGCDRWECGEAEEVGEDIERTDERVYECQPVGRGGSVSVLRHFVLDRVMLYHAGAAAVAEILLVASMIFLAASAAAIMLLSRCSRIMLSCWS